MKTLIPCIALLAAYAAPAQAAERSPACEAKRASIESQITEATARGRTQEVAGLKKALKANLAHCTVQSLEAERQKKIKAAQRKVVEREKSLAEAEQKGKPDKIADRKTKLEAARQDLAQAEKPLLP